VSLSHASKDRIAVLAICLAALMFGLEISSVPAVLPTIQKELHAGFSSVQWIMNAYTIACTTVLMAAGTLADRYGRKRLLLGSVCAFGATSLVCGWAGDAWLLIASRFLQGMSGGAMVICQIAALSQRFHQGPRRSRAFAAWGIIFGVGLGFGPLVGSAIVLWSQWHWVFLIQGPLALLTMALIAISVDESRDPEAKQLDLAGMVSLSLAVFGLTFFITQGPVLGFASAIAVGSLLLSLASFAAFVRVERRHAHPMFDFSVLRIRAFAGALYGSMGMNFSFWPLMIYLPIYFQAVLGYGVAASGLALLAYTLPPLIVPPLAERMVLRYHARRVIPLGLLTIGLGFFVMRLHNVLAPVAPSWLVGCVLAGIGLGLTNTPVSNTTTGAVSPTRAGMASGIDMSARLISLAINIALMGFLLLQGVFAYLQRVSEGAVDTSQLQHMAARIAAGDASQTSMARMALAQGFDWVMLYGGACAWILATASFLTFGARMVATTSAGRCATECA